MPPPHLAYHLAIDEGRRIYLVQELQERTSLFWGERVISRGLRALLPIPSDYLALIDGANGAHGLLPMDAIDANAAAVAALLAAVPDFADGRRDSVGGDASREEAADPPQGDALSMLCLKVRRPAPYPLTLIKAFASLAQIRTAGKRAAQRQPPAYASWLAMPGVASRWAGLPSKEAEGESVRSTAFVIDLLAALLGGALSSLVCSHLGVAPPRSRPLLADSSRRRPQSPAAARGGKKTRVVAAPGACRPISDFFKAATRK